MKMKQASELGNLQMLVGLTEELLAEQRRTNQLLEWLGGVMQAPTAAPLAEGQAHT